MISITGRQSALPGSPHVQRDGRHTGQVFRVSSGSWVDDQHRDGGHGCGEDTTVAGYPHQLRSPSSSPSLHRVPLRPMIANRTLVALGDRGLGVTRQPRQDMTSPTIDSKTRGPIIAWSGALHVVGAIPGAECRGPSVWRIWPRLRRIEWSTDDE